MNISDGTLLKTSAYIDGAWVTGKQTFAVTNPATGAHLADIADLSALETNEAIQAAEQALPAWRALTAKERSIILKRWHDLIVAASEDLAQIMTAEQGKPIAEARGEIGYGASFIEWFAEEAKRVYGDVIPSHGTDKRIIVLKQPIGVVAAITPWNFPSAMITRKVAPALAAGCTAVIKPSEFTPLSALALAELAGRAGIPKGVINIVTGLNAAEIGGELTSNPIVRKLSFTGSTAVGKLLMRQASDTVKKVSLELGGNAPFIVFDDADIDQAVAGAILCKYRNAGQTCVSANRFFVQEGIYDVFAAKFKLAVEALKIGNGMHDGVTVGPLINDKALEKVETLVMDALKKGAVATAGGHKSSLGGTWYEPTVLTGVTMGMDIATTEIFGPIAALFRFKDEGDVIKLANDTPYGLAAYFYARDIGRVWRVAEALEYGMVAVNEGVFSTEVAPFGGIKQSGIGREGSKYGIDDFTEMKYVCLGGI